MVVIILSNTPHRCINSNTQLYSLWVLSFKINNITIENERKNYLCTYL
nr:MAG TPA: hypothetical protein [Caudoviricetes sp.]